jgi:hypothetical protein
MHASIQRIAISFAAAYTYLALTATTTSAFDRVKSIPPELQGHWLEILEGTPCSASALTAEIGSGTLEIQPDLSCTILTGSASHYDTGTGSTKKLAGVTAQFSCPGQEGQQRFSRTMVLGTYAIGKLTVLVVADVNLAWISAYSKCPQ